MKSMNEEQFKVILGLYSKKGYQITKEPENQDEIPEFLSSLDYYPDYIIRSDSINYVVELSSSKNFNDEKKLKGIIEEVEEHKGWEFILVVVEKASGDEKPGQHIKSKDKKPGPDIKPKNDKPGRDVKPKADKPVSNVKQKDEKPASDFELEVEESDLNFEPEDEQSDIDFEPEVEKSGLNSESEVETSEIDLEPEDIRQGTGSDSITKGYLNLKLMLENKQFESYQESVLLYGWTLLDSMIRKLIEKERTGMDIGFLLNEAVSDNIIDKSEISGLKNVYLLRNKVVNGEFGCVTEKHLLEPLITVINKLYGEYFS